MLRLALILMLFAAPAIAEEVKHPMPPEQRAKFEKFVAQFWHDDCQCYRFIFEGKMKEVHRPVDDDLAWSILGVIEHNEAIPIKPAGVAH